ncbi:hypothetical protein FE257_009628 [Aspergillus nanangensis]|uniref:Uncharacterized protein n=1 Tax=Aspergillus nanangensis TaxID=2582783 RepID=A0AAD4CLK2_ASPNN|nr:hypothetical protein FE257_009628 [Aspergillus nanangensis]
MYSYHRVLAVFGRSVNDKDLECNCDIHPWEIQINGEQWPGKIRLVGFIDVFFLISYSANGSFEQGIIVYKEKRDIQWLLNEVKRLRPNDSASQVAQQEQETPASVYDSGDANNGKGAQAVTANESNIPNEEYFGPDTKADKTEDTQTQTGSSLEFTNSGGVYRVKGWGHEIDVKCKYSIDSVQEYNIQISKPRNRAVRTLPTSGHIKRGIKEHTTLELLEDGIRCGFIAHGQMTGEFLSKYLVGGVVDDTLKKHFAGVMSANRPGNQALSNEAGR